MLDLSHLLKVWVTRDRKRKIPILAPNFLRVCVKFNHLRRISLAILFFKIRATYLDETKKYFECHICNNKLTKRYLLNRHIVSVHEGIKPVECKICCAKLSSKKYLDHHIASVHNGKRPFKCNIYNVKFASKKKEKEIQRSKARNNAIWMHDMRC